MEDETRAIYRSGMAVFENIAPEYHIELRERPDMNRDFHSRLLEVQMMFSFMLVDETVTLKMCPNCYKWYSGRASMWLFEIRGETPRRLEERDRSGRRHGMSA